MTRERLWTWLAILLPAFAATVAPVATGDLAYQVRAGELMLAGGRVVTSDPFTFTAAGQPWLNQQWGTGIILAVIHDAAGWGGLALFRTILIAAIVGTVYLACRAQPAGSIDARPGERTAAGLALVGFLVGIGALALRAQLLGILCYVLSLLLVARRGAHPRSVWLVPIVEVAWANVHGSFFLGPAMLAVAAIDDFLAGRTAWRHAAGATVLAGLASCATPFGPDVWRYAVGLSTNPLVAGIVSEWQHTAPISGLGVVFYGSVAAVAAMVGLAWRRGSRLGVASLAWLLGLAVMGAYAERGVVWWALGAPVAIAPAVGALTARTPSSRTARPEPAGLRRLNAVVAAAVAALIVLLQPVLRPTTDTLTGPAGTLRDAPAGLARELAHLAGSSDRVVVSQAWASWFEWAAPGVPVMVDSRIEVLPPDAWRAYLTIVQAGPDALPALARIGATAVVVDPVEIGALGRLLASSTQWHLAYQDSDGSIYTPASKP